MSVAAEAHNVTLITGPEQARIPANRQLLVFFSDFFERGLYRKFSEAGQATFALPEVVSEDFKIFMAWTYIGNSALFKFANIDRYAHIVLVLDDNKSDANGLQLIRLWILGDMLLSKGFCNDIILTLGRYFENKYITPDMVQTTYDSTTEQSQLRTLIRDVVTLEGPFGDSSADRHEDKWRQLILHGGDAVLDIATHGGFEGTPLHKASRLYNYPQIEQYIEEESQITATEWLAKHAAKST
jgi:hypothetical protein